MIGFPTMKDFNVFFSEDFILPEVKEEFSELFNIGSTNIKMVDYLSATIVGADILGYDNPTTQQQVYGRGKTRTFEGGHHRDNKVSKMLRLSFSLREGLLNYMILYRNIEQFNKSIIRNRDLEDIFLPPIFVFVYDPHGVISYVWEYREIQIPDLPQLSLRKDDRGANNKDFDVNVVFNQMKFHNKIPKSINFSGIDKKYRHEFL
jgi:hypothetical protein